MRPRRRRLKEWRISCDCLCIYSRVIIDEDGIGVARLGLN